MADINELVERITEKDNNAACSAAEQLAGLSINSSAVYEHMDYFISLLDDKNSYVRNRVLVLISANAKWDSENKIDGAIEKYLSHITDQKPITARQCIKSLPEIAERKPKLSDKILCALKNADVSGYADSMRPLVEKDIANAAAYIEEISIKP